MISIVVPARNEEENITNLLESIEQQKYSKAFETIVVDGNSTDRTPEIAKRYGCRVIQQSGKLGVSNARNEGWKNARGDIIVFLEADETIDKNFLSEIDKVFKEKEIDNARPQVKVVEKNLVQKIMRTQIELSRRRQKSWTFPIIYRKHVLEKTGGYDEKLGFAEDRELPERVHKKGFTTVLIKNAYLYDNPVNSLKKLWRQGMWYGRNMLPYIKKNKDYMMLIGVLIHSLVVPILLLGFFNEIFLLMGGGIFLLMFLRSVLAFIHSKSPYAFLLPLIWVVRGTGSFIGIVQSQFVKHQGK